jgi:hypothetical protein
MPNRMWSERRRVLPILLLALLACVPVTPKEPPIGRTPPPTLPTGPVTFEFESVDDSSVSAPAFRGKPAVLAFLTTDSLAGQAQATILARLAVSTGDSVRFAIVALEAPEQHELVQGFVGFFRDKAHAPLLGAMADADTRLGQGPFGDVRGLPVVVLDAAGRIAFRKSGVVQPPEITLVLRAM